MKQNKIQEVAKQLAERSKNQQKADGKREGRLVIIENKPPVGDNTTIMLYLVGLSAVYDGIASSYFSFGMSNEKIVDRLISILTGIDQQKIDSGQLSDDEWKLLDEKLLLLMNAPLYVDDTPAMTLADLKSKLTDLAGRGVRRMMIDHAQQVTADGQDTESILEEVGILARQLCITIIAVTAKQEDLTMIIGSHNSWSYLSPRKWWMKPLAFVARCQSVDIQTQYKLGVRCFDLRVRFNKYSLGVVAHGIVEYCFTASKVYEDLAWLNDRGDCYVRVIHEVRSASQYKNRSLLAFGRLCSRLEFEYEDICFWCGRNLYDWEKDYDFGVDPTCEENYGSVSSKWLAWWPWLYARLNNRRIHLQGTDKEILLIDYINI